MNKSLLIFFYLYIIYFCYAVPCGLNNTIFESTNQVYTWGSNSNGQLGDGTQDDKKTLVAVDTGGVLKKKNVKFISANFANTVAVTTDNRDNLNLWGDNEVGELGSGSSFSNILIPTAVDTTGVLNGEVINVVAVGYYHVVAITKGKSLLVIII
jgi:alpha-tubulin suppressor-like RCC1 family protein